MLTRLMHLIFIISQYELHTANIHKRRNEPHSEYENLWKKELIDNNLQSVYHVFSDQNLFATEFLLYLNIDGFIQISKELCLDLNDMEIYKLSIIAWKIYQRQNMIDEVGIHYLQDEDGLNEDENDTMKMMNNGAMKQRRNKQRGFGIYI